MLLCDADLGLFNTSAHLGIKKCGNLADLLAGKSTLRNAVVHVPCGTRHGFDLLAAPASTGTFPGVGESAFMTMLATLESAGDYDRMLVDLGAGVDGAVMCLASRADETLLMMTLDPASPTDAYAFTKLVLRRTGMRPPEVLVDMALNETERRRVAETLLASTRSFLKVAPDHLGFIPYDARVSDAVRRQSPPLSTFPQSPASLAIEGIARKLHVAERLELPAAGLR